MENSCHAACCSMAYKRIKSSYEIQKFCIVVLELLKPMKMKNSTKTYKLLRRAVNSCSKPNTRLPSRHAKLGTLSIRRSSARKTRAPETAPLFLTQSSLAVAVVGCRRSFRELLRIRMGLYLQDYRARIGAWAGRLSSCAARASRGPATWRSDGALGATS